METQTRSGIADSQWAGAVGVDAGLWRTKRGSSECDDVSRQYGIDLFSYYFASESPNGPAQVLVEPRAYAEFAFKQHKGAIGAEVRTSQLANDDGSHFDSTRAALSGSWRWLDKPNLFEIWRVVGTFSNEWYENRDRSSGATAADRDGTVTTGSLQVRWYKPKSMRHFNASLFRRSRVATGAFLTVSDQIDRGGDNEINSSGWSGTLDLRFAHILNDPDLKQTRVQSRIDLTGGLAHDTFRALQGASPSDWNPTSFGRAAVTIPFGEDAAWSVVFALQHASEPTGDRNTSGSLVLAWDSTRPWKLYKYVCGPKESPDDGASTSTPANTGPSRPIVTRITEPN